MKSTFFIFLFFSSAALYSQTLVLDNSFNGTGITTMAPALSSHAGGGIAVQADGKIVVSGNAYINGEEDILISRFLPDGSPDLSFNKSGSVILNGSHRDAGVSKPMIDSKGRIVIVSTYEYGTDHSGPLVVRVLTNGTPDPSFANDGVRLIRGFKGDSRTSSGVVLPDDKIILSGLHRYNGSQWQCFVVKLKEDGLEDNEFRNKGQLFIPVNEIEETSVFTMLQPDGKILIGGNAYSYATKSRHFFVCRLQPDGTLDESFGKNGKAFIGVAPETDYPNGALLTSSGQIICFGKYQTKDPGFKGSIVRFNSNGSGDAGFGKKGNLIIDFSPNNEIINDVIELPDHTFMVAIQVPELNSTFMLMHLDASGQLIKTFGINGYYSLKMAGPTGGAAQRMWMQADGKLLVAGTNSLTEATSEIALVRFTFGIPAPASAQPVKSGAPASPTQK